MSLYYNNSSNNLMALALCLFISFLSIVPFSNLFLSLARTLIQLLAGAHHFPWLGDDDLSLGDATSLSQLLLRPHRRHEVSINLNVARYERRSNDDEAAAGDDAAEDCVFCLCGIEEGEEIRELRCRHVFHRHCLDRWLAHRRPAPTCPLCRDALVPPHEAAGTKGGGGLVTAADDDEELGCSAAVILLAYVQWLMWLPHRVGLQKMVLTLSCTIRSSPDFVTGVAHLIFPSPAHTTLSNKFSHTSITNWHEVVGEKDLPSPDITPMND